MATAEKKTETRIAELKALGTGARQCMYQRVRLAWEIVSDKKWLKEAMMGDVNKAYDFLLHVGFAELTDVFTVGELISIMTHFPDESTWTEYAYNLHALRRLVRQKEKGEPGSLKRMSWKARAEALEQENAELRAENAELKLRVGQLEGELRGIQNTLRGYREERAAAV